MSDNHPAEPAWPLDGPPRDPSSTPALKNNLQWLALVVPVVVAAMIYLCLRIRNMRRQHKHASDNEQVDQEGWLIPSSARRHASSSSCLAPSTTTTATPTSHHATRRLPLVRFSDPPLQQPPAIHYHQRPTQYRTTTHHVRRHHHRRRTRRSRPRTPPPAYPGSSSPPPPSYDDIVIPMDDHRENEPLAHLQNALLSHHQHYASSVAARSS
ncbi:predicted protein [Lichtheimia corymbifera JMRC:FSU:9682]|uniref:Uncharacterized protein n=1 Tax=Lichtheimia corymbifera JMRC:FSU:9682 TaxID=1263082 RepID=A0A068SEQ5_9FUNG|nr:predicted protein [Lichtheimia corymbifera JMRC:FSU:9682]